MDSDDIGIRLDRNLDYDESHFQRKDLKPCFNWDTKNKLCNILYTARISPKYGQWDSSNFHKNCEGLSLPSLCCAFNNPFQEKPIKAQEIPKIILFEV
jgi:hypothetical protein